LNQWSQLVDGQAFEVCFSHYLFLSGYT
jgi:hypothetical protein